MIASSSSVDTAPSLFHILMHDLSRLHKRKPFHLAASRNAVIATYVFHGADGDDWASTSSIALMEACIRNHEGAVEALCQLHCALNREVHIRYQEKNALHVAVSDNYPRIADLLLSYGADINILNDRCTPLFVAAGFKGDVEMTRVLMKYRVMPHPDDGSSGGSGSAAAPPVEQRLDVDAYCEGDTVISRATKRKHIETCRILVRELGANVNLVPQSGHTPLITAINSKLLHLVEAVLVRRADASYWDPMLPGVLSASVAWKYPMPTGEIEAAAQVNLEDAETGQTPLMWALNLNADSYLVAHIVKMLLAFGADVSLRDKLGNSAFMFAAANGHLDALRLIWNRNLELRGSSSSSNVKPMAKVFGVNDKNHKGSTALMLAMTYDIPEVVVFLLQRGAARNIVDADGWTPVMYAAINHRVTTVTELMKKRPASFYVDLEDSSTVAAETEEVNLNIINVNHETAVMIASQYGHLDVVKLLVEAGAGVHYRNWWGHTAAKLAKKHGRLEVVEFLVAHGAVEPDDDKVCSAS